MGNKVFDRVKVTCATTGTGNLTLGPALPGFQTFAEDGAADLDNVAFVIEDAGGFEISWGQLGGSGTILSRNVIGSSNGGLPLDLSGNAVVYSAINKSEWDGKLSLDGGVMTGKLAAAAPTVNGAGLNVGYGVEPGAANQVNGDVWTTSSGLFFRANDAKFQVVTTGTLNSYVKTIDFTFANLGSKPTTLAGYGITDAVASVNFTFANLGGKPTTLAGYGITDAVPSSQKGAANGVATLDGTGKVPSAQLPSYVDDVLEYANLAGFPGTGESGKIYIAIDTGWEYRWSGSTYVRIVASPGSTDAVPEGSTNLYFTNARAAAAAPVQSVAGKTGAVTLAKGDVGLGNVDNTSDANKPISTATQTALDGKQKLIAVGTVAPSNPSEGDLWVDTN